MNWPTGEERALAELIWTTSRGDESTISATGANIIADAIMDSGWLILRDARSRAEALREAADAYGPAQITYMGSATGYVKAWLRERAARHEDPTS